MHKKMKMQNEMLHFRTLLYQILINWVKDYQTTNWNVKIDGLFQTMLWLPVCSSQIIKPKNKANTIFQSPKSNVKLVVVWCLMCITLSVWWYSYAIKRYIHSFPISWNPFSTALWMAVPPTQWKDHCQMSSSQALDLWLDLWHRFGSCWDCFVGSGPCLKIKTVFPGMGISIQR